MFLRKVSILVYIFCSLDPFAPDHIMQPQQSINGYFSSCFLSTYFYFALPRTIACSLIPYSVIKPKTLYRDVKKVIFCPFCVSFPCNATYFYLNMNSLPVHSNAIVETKVRIKKNHGND